MIISDLFSFYDHTCGYMSTYPQLSLIFPFPFSPFANHPLVLSPLSIPLNSSLLTKCLHFSTFPISFCSSPVAHSLPERHSPAWASLTTSEWEASRTLAPLILMIMSPTSRPEVSAGVSGSMADTTTGRDPWILNPNSPESRLTVTVLSDSVGKVKEIIYLRQWGESIG